MIKKMEKLNHKMENLQVKDDSAMDIIENINEEKDKKHDHIIFSLSKNQKLIYNDIRKLGFIKFIKRTNLYQNAHLKILGPEPLSAKFISEYFAIF